MAAVAVVALVVAGCSSDRADDPLSASARTSATPTSAVVTTTAGGAGPCPSPTLERETGAVGDPAMAEVSGAAASATHPGRVWVHQDSGNPPVLTLLDSGGATVGAWTVEGAENRDWEDVAVVADPPTLFVGDIGDNQAVRDEISVVRIPEPPDAASGSIVPDAVVRLVLPEPVDAEALLVDPRSGDVVIVTKQLSGRADVLVAPEAAWLDGTVPLSMSRRGTLELGLLDAVLAGDVSADGSEIVLRTPARVLWWPRRDGESIADALLGREPCPLPSVLDPFGEAIALLPDGGYLLVGEGVNAPLHRAR